jgi:AraC-like DNA-binding protein
MDPAFEKLIPPPGRSFRCFDRSSLDQPFKWHHHPEIEITLVVAGRGRRFVGDHIDNYDDGDLVLLGANLPHTWASEDFVGMAYDTHPAIVIQFHPGCLGERFFELPEMARIADLLERAKRGLFFSGETRQKVARRMIEMTDQSGAPLLVGLLSVLDWLSEADDAVPLASEGYTPSLRGAAQSRLDVVCRHINEHFSESELGPAQLAPLVDMGPPAFCRFFKRATGRTVTEYTNELRIGRACRLLVESDRSIMDICFDVGFQNVSNFNRRFRALKKMSPRQFRKQCRRTIDSPP